MDWFEKKSGTDKKIQVDYQMTVHWPQKMEQMKSIVNSWENPHQK